jgi:SAM-dependent methyltransferase
MAVSFDRIANIYDATRWAGVPRPIMEKILSAMKDMLKDCRSILDIGTGTGRFAQFFKDSGFNVVGVDISLRMMAEAREKGVRDLVRADAQHLPFRNGSFDGSIMIHVLHLVENWVRVVHEVGRVTKRLLISEAGDTEGFSPRQSYLELRAEMGYPLNRFNDSELGLRKLIPPKFIVSAGDYWTEVNSDEEITSFEARKSSVMWDVPEEVHGRIMQRLHSEHHGKTVRRHDIAEVVGWDPARLRAFKQ